MKKFYIFVIIALIALGIAIYFFTSNNKSNNANQTNYNSTRVSSTDNTNENNNSNYNTISSHEDENSNQEDNPKNVNELTETQIADFTTKIYTKDSDRQKNISITCSALNDTIIENEETFSFCDTVGKATSSKGYKKADVYKDGKLVQALGGGNCQVSSTLYNAVLEVDNLKVTERHSHSNSVPYVSEGKDAAVAYDSYDLKFVNNTRE